MLKVCLKFWEFGRKFRVWKEWIRVVENDFEMIGNWWNGLEMIGELIGMGG